MSAENRALYPQSVVSPQVPGTSLFAYVPGMTKDISVFLVCIIEIKVVKLHSQVSLRHCQQDCSGHRDSIF